MFQLDEQFLHELGLGAMPDEQKKPFLQHIYEQLEQRVGLKLSEGMSDEQLEEFEAIIDKKPEVVEAWVARYAPAYKEDELSKKIQQAMNGASMDSTAFKAEYAATKWLEVNRPDYRNVVASTLEQLKQEIISGRDVILGSSNQ